MPRRECETGRIPLESTVLGARERNATLATDVAALAEKRQRRGVVVLFALGTHALEETRARDQTCTNGEAPVRGLLVSRPISRRVVNGLGRSSSWPAERSRLERPLAPLTCSAYKRDVCACLERDVIDDLAEVLSDERSVRSDDEPEAAELGHVLAEDLQRLRVAHVVVERSAGVGDLKLSVTALDRPK